MSYDLHLIAPSTASSDREDAGVAFERVAGLKAARGHEVLRIADFSPGALLVSIAVQGDDADTSALWKSLVRLARKHDYVLSDPQWGAVDLAVPGNYPPGWSPSGAPVSGRSLASKTKNLIVDFLRPHGFARRGKWHAVRFYEGLEQGLYFQKGTGSRSGSFTVNVYWSFTAAPMVEGAMDVNRRIGLLMAGAQDHWFGGAEPLDRAFEQARDALLQVAVPYLDRHTSVEGLVAAYEAGDLAMTDAFGLDEGWQWYNLAFCYLQLDRPADAVRAFRTLVDEHSENHLEYRIREARAAGGEALGWIPMLESELAAFKGSDDDWVFQREKAARARLAELGTP